MLVVEQKGKKLKKQMLSYIKTLLPNLSRLIFIKNLLLAIININKEKFMKYKLNNYDYFMIKNNLYFLKVYYSLLIICK